MCHRDMQAFSFYVILLKSSATKVRVSDESSSFVVVCDLASVDFCGIPNVSIESPLLESLNLPVV